MNRYSKLIVLDLISRIRIMIKNIYSRQQNSSSSSSDYNAYAVALLIVALIVIVFTFNPNLGYLSDCSRYYLVGQSIAAGAGFVQIWDAEKPPDGLSSPLYPLMIAALSQTVSESILTMKVMTGLFFLGSIWIYFRLFKRIGLSKEALMLTLLPLIFNYWVQIHASLMLTELPFMFLSGCGLLFYLKSENDDKAKNLNWWLALLFAVLTFYMRTIGIVLALSIVLNELSMLRWKRALVAAIIFIGIFLPWLIRGMYLDVLTHFDLISALNPLVPFGAKADFFDIVQRIDINVINYTSVYLPSSIIPISRWFSNQGNIFSWLLGISLLGTIAYGMLNIGKDRLFFMFYLLSYFAILLLYPQAYSGHRFLLALLPLLYLGLYTGLSSLANKLKNGTKYSLGIMILIAILNLWSLRSLDAELSKPLLPQWKGYFEVANWAGDNLTADAVIATRIGQEFYLYSIRKTVQFPFFEDTDEILGYLKYKNVTHIVSDDLDYPITDMRESTGIPLETLRNASPESLKEVYVSKTGETKLFEFQYIMPIKGVKGRNEKIREFKLRDK